VFVALEGEFELSEADIEVDLVLDVVFWELTESLYTREVITKFLSEGNC
jgi:hypothetical protein